MLQHLLVQFAQMIKCEKCAMANHIITRSSQLTLLMLTHHQSSISLFARSGKLVTRTINYGLLKKTELPNNEKYLLFL